MATQYPPDILLTQIVCTSVAVKSEEMANCSNKHSSILHPKSKERRYAWTRSISPLNRAATTSNKEDFIKIIVENS